MVLFVFINMSKEAVIRIRSGLVFFSFFLLHFSNDRWNGRRGGRR